MKHRKGKWVAMLLVLALTLTMVPEAAFAAEVSNMPSTEEQVTESDGETQEESDPEELQSSGQTSAGNTDPSQEQTGTGDTDQPQEQTGTSDTDQPQEQPEAGNAIQSKVATAGNSTQTESSVAKIGDACYDTLALAFENAIDGDTIVLLKDTSENSIIAVNAAVTLSLNGNVITNNVGEERLFNVTASSFTIDGTIEGSGMEIPESNSASYGFIKVSAKSLVTLNGGTYRGNTDNGAFVKIFENGSGATVKFDGVSMTSNNRFFDTNTIQADASIPTLQVEGGTYVTDGIAFSTDTMAPSSVEFSGTSVTAGTGPCIELCGSAGTFADCNFEVTNNTNPSHFSATAVAVSYSGTAVINGGTYRSTGYGVYVYSSGGTITVNDGTISGSVAAVKADVDSQSYASAKASVVVNGGRTEGAWKTNGNENATLTVLGGSHTFDVSEYVSPGLDITQDDEGNYVVVCRESVYVSGNGNDSNSGEDASHAVKTLKRALELVADDGTIYVCGTVTVDSSRTVDGAKIERADGYTGSLISVSGSDTVLTLSDTVIDGRNAAGILQSGYLLNINSNATVNIEGETKIVNNKTTAVYMSSNTELNMNGGTISGNDSSEFEYTYGGAVCSFGGNVNLNGGRIENNKAPWGGAIMAFGGSEIILNGTVIAENTATLYGGGGIYLYGDNSANPVVLEVQSGSIVGNVAEYGTGGGIMAHYQNGDVAVKISGGSIKENSCTAEKSGSAITIFGANGSTAYPRLELSGSPEIVGDIFCQNDYENGYVIYVTDEFSPVCPVEITRSNNIFDIPAVEYAAGLTPDRENFTSGTIFEGFVVKGQNLVWAKASIVYFYDEDKTEYKDNRHGVVLGEKIDIADAPTPTKTGYSLEGWYAENSTEPWNFEEDVVQDPSTRLYARWSLNAPTVTLSADDATPHIGSSATLTAKASHDLAGVTYTYQWYKDGKAIEGATSDKLTISEAGSYSVKVKASDGEQISAETEGTPVEVSIEDHTFGEWTQITSPTCENQGSEQRVCSVCQYTETRNVDPLGHDWETEFTVDKAPTCTQAGSQSIHCKNCDAVKDSAVMPATGHTQSAEWKTDENNHWKVCTACGETIDAAAHSFKWVVDKEATAEAAGSKHEECTVCGYAKDAVEIPATGTTGEPSEPSKPEATPTEPPKDNSETGTTAGPQTGDNSNMNLWFALAGVGVAGLGATILFQKRRKIKE